jgi:glycosyltransferase involved in cell wall biosynthesis
MRFFCLLPVRDEADIIGQCLQRLSNWADRIFVFDTGSVDNTWEIVLEQASKNTKIRPIAKDDVYYSESRLRGYIFDIARREMKEGDWFMRVDADEFHYITPQQFIRERLQKHETIVYHQYYNFELTHKEASRLSTTESVLEERRRPIDERRRHYSISVYSEPRLCRYRSTMKWPETISFPFNAGFIARERLPILHYPNRDPMQMERRCKLRAVMLADKENKLNWGADADTMHWTIEDWTKFLVDDHDPSLQYWVHGTRLREVRQFNHLGSWYQRILKRMVHAYLLPFMDVRRPGFSTGAYPMKISPEVISTLNRTLSVLPQTTHKENLSLTVPSINMST